MFRNGHWGKWALGANGHLGKEYPKCSAVPIPQFFSNRHLGPQVPIYSSAHFVLVPIWEKWTKWRYLGYSFPPKVNFSPKPQVPIFPSAHWQKFWVIWAQSIWCTPLGHLGYPLPLNAHLPNCPFSKIWGKWAQGTCSTPLGHLRYPFPPNVLGPICHDGHMQTFGEMDTGHWGNSFREIG